MGNGPMAHGPWAALQYRRSFRDCQARPQPVQRGPPSKEELGQAGWTLLHTLVANFPDAPMLGDATEVAEWPACDLLTAGFPCQPFSYASTAARRQTHPCRDFFEVVERMMLSSTAGCGEESEARDAWAR